MFGYKKLPALAQVLLVIENLHRFRWEWIFGLNSRKASVYNG